MKHRYLKKIVSQLAYEALANTINRYDDSGSCNLAKQEGINNPTMPRVRSQFLAYDVLKRHYDTTVGLWVIDRDPCEVSKEWIDENTFQIMGPVTTQNDL